MKLSSTLLALSLLPMLAPLSTYAQDKDKSDKAIDKSDKSAEKAVDKVDKQDKAGNKAAVDYDVHSYRLIYTLTEIESGKKVGEQHYSMVVNPGSKQGNIRIGSKVPIKTGHLRPRQRQAGSGAVHIYGCRPQYLRKSQRRTKRHSGQLLDQSIHHRRLTLRDIRPAGYPQY